MTTDNSRKMVRAAPKLMLSALTALGLALAGSARAQTADQVTVTGHRLLPPSGPTISATGANDYSISAGDIADLPAGSASPLTDVLAQMPGVAIDQNQQIHIRNTEGPQFQYQIDGVLVPLDINTNPPFLTMINPLFIKKLDLIDGVLPARFSYATGGVVDIQTKDGCQQPGGSVGLTAGQREVVQPSAQFAGCDGRFSYYVSGLYDQGQTAFSQATPGANPIHDFTNQGQLFGILSYAATPSTQISLIVSAAASDNQLPNVAGLTPQYALSGVGTPPPSAQINSRLNFRDDLAMLSLNGGGPDGISYQLAYTAHFISQAFRPDDVGELIYQGEASTATHYDEDNTLQGDLTGAVGAHTLGAGFYLGDYHVTAEDASLVFPVFLSGERISTVSAETVQTPPTEPSGLQASTTPEQVIADTRATNILVGLYVNDLWRITNRLRADLGLRFDQLSGFTNHSQVDPTLNLSYQLTAGASLHAGAARYMQVPSFQGISPDASRVFNATTGAEPDGIATPLTEDDYETDLGVVVRLGSHMTVSEDAFYERTDHYLDTGQFGVTPIFAPFNYGHGYIWGDEMAVTYRGGGLSAYANLTLGENRQKGVATGQFNFDPDELAYIDAHTIPLDHQPLAGLSAGGTYRIGAYQVSLDGLYSSGLRGGFADQTQLPSVVQVNGSVQRGFRVPGIGQVVDRLTVLNAFDRVNLIRPAEGIGIFQSAYGPRFTVLDTVSLAF